jgi:hypothetical protein
MGLMALPGLRALMDQPAPMEPTFLDRFQQVMSLRTGSSGVLLTQNGT